MKKILFSLCAVVITTLVFAQAPPAFKYQAVARDLSGTVLAGKAVTFKISVIQGTVTGAIVYSELHAKTTNAYGLVDLEIGKGSSPSGSFSSINWGADAFFVKVEMDPSGGISFQHMGTSQLQSVPYALHAKTVENVPDNDPSNEIQALSLNGSQLTLSKGGGTVILPTSGTGGDNWGTQSVITDGTLTGNGLSVNSLKIADNGVTSIKIADETIATADLADNAVNNAKIIDTAVSTNKLANNAVTAPKLASMGATSGQVLTYSGTAWAPQTVPVTFNPWVASGSDIYFNTGKVGIGTNAPTGLLNILGNSSTTLPQLLLTENESDFSRLMFKTSTSATKNWTLAAKTDATDANSQLNFNYFNGSTGSDLFTITGGKKAVLNTQLGIGMTPGNDNVEIFRDDLNYIRMYTTSSGTGSLQGFLAGISGLNSYLWNYENGSLQIGTNNMTRMIILASGNVGIGDSTPEATLDVEGTVTVGSGGVVFSEIKEITGTLDADGVFAFAFPAGYTITNMRVLSLEVNYNGTAWVGLASTVNYSTDIAKLFYYLGSTIQIYYPNVAQYQNRAFRMLVMKIS